MSKTIRKKFLLTLAFSAVFILGLILADFQFVRFLYSLGELSKQAQAELDRTVGRHQALRSESRRFEELEAMRQEFESFFVSPDNPLLFIEAVERLGKRAGLTTELALVQGPRPGVTAYSLTVSGSYAGLMLFLERLEYLPFAARIAEFRLGAAAATRFAQVPAAPKSPAMKEFQAEFVIHTLEAKEPETKKPEAKKTETKKQP